ncbi:hypothetical protein D3871_18135 [Noviherbaspirillum saxi]|uniref:HTH cro/C1-type domain-containing protein n=2 Tax=Noviherbaspirillum saxi TaxID=2320863 RepID=A0A3A3G7W4_9BURK|nr:hypothetical protein D3871_18135 [Noviherbaspirillum saxi]
MNSNTFSRIYDPNRLLDTVKERLGIDNDKALSRKLLIAKPVISNIRAGHVPLGASMLLGISESTGTSVDELRRILGDRRATLRLSFVRATPGAYR